MIRVGIVTASDKGSRGEREDVNGRIVEEMVAEIGGTVVFRAIVPDEQDKIREALMQGADTMDLDLIVTTGGTGVSPRDVTPDATRDIIHREIPGFAEAMRREGLTKTPHAMISRGVCGIRGCTVIINLPGSPKAVREGLGVVLPALRHTIEQVRGDPRDCAE